MLSPVRLSVRPSVYLSDEWIIQKRLIRIMKFSPYGSPVALVFAGKFHSEILWGSIRAEPSNKGGVGKISSFLCLNVNISKTIADTAKVTINEVTYGLSIDTQIDDLG